jgi:mxaA protein
LLVLLAAWLAWWLWRNAREARRRPFARAWGELRRLDDASPQAWRVLHRALNASAGHVIHAASLPALLAEAPYLRPLQQRLEDFYRESTQRFFAADPAAPAPAGAYPLRALCRALRDAERRYA